MSRPAHARIPSIRALALVLAALVLVAGCAAGDKTVTIDHAKVPDATLVDGGPAGASVGDVRLWHFAVTRSDGATGWVDVIMTTTGVDEAGAFETRETRLVFAFGDGADQVIVDGTATYPGANATIAQASVIRPVIGGSGIYAGANGWAESTFHADGTWTHVLHLKG